MDFGEPAENVPFRRGGTRACAKQWDVLIIDSLSHARWRDAPKREGMDSKRWN